MSSGDESDGLDEVDRDLNSAVEVDDPADDLMVGNLFEKTDEYEKFLDGPNPPSTALRRPLRASQVIGSRWMLDRHTKGGGLVKDKVGTGKVRDYCVQPYDRHIKPYAFCNC